MTGDDPADPSVDDGRQEGRDNWEWLVDEGDRDVSGDDRTDLEFVVEHPASSPNEAEPETPSVTAFALLSDAIGRLRTHPRVVRAMLFAGVVVAVVDFLRRGDPVPTAGYAGLQTGEVSINFGFVVNVVSRASTPLSALIDLRPVWLARTIWLELARGGAVFLATVYGFARLLDVKVTAANAGRYLLAFAFFGALSFDVDLGFVIGIVVLVLFFAVLVRLSMLPGLLIAGDSMLDALRRSWGLTKGHGWSLFGVVFVVGLANHALGSVPVVGPVGSSLAAAAHVAVVVAFLDRVDAVDIGAAGPGG